MVKIPLAVWIANAAARLAGGYGDVTRQAEAADCSRQTIYDHAQKVQAAVAVEHAGGPTHAELIQENEYLRQENARLWDWLAQTIEFPPGKRHEFTVTATAMGLSLNQVLVLLAIIMGTQAHPGRATIQRGHKADDRTGATWSQHLQGWTALQYVLADAGTGLQAGIALVQQQRREGQQTPLEDGLDVFHTTQEGQRALSQTWNQVETLREEAEAATRRVERARRHKGDTRGVATAAASAWKEAEAALARYEAAEAGWARARSALRVFRPDGQLNDRVGAQQQIAAALPHLCGRHWSKVRGFLQAAPTQTFLDRLHRQLQEAEPNAALREALVRLWWLRRQRPRGSNEGAVAGAGHVAHLVQRVVCQRLDVHWAESYQRVSG